MSARLNMHIAPDLRERFNSYAEERNTTMTAIVIGYIQSLVCGEAGIQRSLRLHSSEDVVIVLEESHDGVLDVHISAKQVTDGQ